MSRPPIRGMRKMMRVTARRMAETEWQEVERAGQVMFP